MIYSTQNESVKTITKPMDWVYAHGQLEEFLAYDNIMTDEVTVIGAYETVKRFRESTVVSTKAMNHNGDIISVDIYLWFNQTMRGLAVSLYDVEGRKFAEEKFKGKPALL
jgi:hypothetical protein